jgi:hypothetical protein
MKKEREAMKGTRNLSTLQQTFRGVLQVIMQEIQQAATGAETPRSLISGVPIFVRLKLDGIGEAEAQVGVTPNIPLRKHFEEIQPHIPSLVLPFDNATRVQKAKELLSAGNDYSKGCSGFVCEVLGIPWEPANDLMGSSPTFVGDNNSYSGLEPGDIAGWTSDAGSGHVTVYVGERGMKFIDVRSEDEAPRKVANGYGNGRKLYKSSRF